VQIRRKVTENRQGLIKTYVCSQGYEPVKRPRNLFATISGTKYFLLVRAETCLLLAQEEQMYVVVDRKLQP
jgi:hypothetical protein